MASRKTHDLSVVVGEYRDRDGNTRKRYQTIGVLMQGDNGPFIMLEKWFNPAGVVDERGGSSLLVSCFAPRDQQQPQQRQAAPAYEEQSGDIPF